MRFLPETSVQGNFQVAGKGIIGSIRRAVLDGRRRFRRQYKMARMEPRRIKIAPTSTPIVTCNAFALLRAASAGSGEGELVSLGSVGELVVGRTDGTFVAGASVLTLVKLVDVSVGIESTEVTLAEEDVVETGADVPVLIDQSVTSKLQKEKVRNTFCLFRE